MGIDLLKISLANNVNSASRAMAVEGETEPEVMEARLQKIRESELTRGVEGHKSISHELPPWDLDFLAQIAAEAASERVKGDNSVGARAYAEQTGARVADTYMETRGYHGSSANHLGNIIDVTA
ncbi:hypothetical protein J4413_03770 [Candidatus Woesearchaeota archaeon]|nr:hypothetical protein [Candidatus Woesearchaeota archaeon]